MRVAIDTSWALRGPSGTATYITSLATALGELGVELVEIGDVPRERGAATGRRGPGGYARSGRNAALGARWSISGFPRAARRAGADLIHHPLPAWSRSWGGPQVCTVHDLAYERLPSAFDPWWRIPARVRHRRAVERCDVVVCVSQSTAADVRSRWAIDASKIVVAPHGAPAARGPAEAVDPPYALYVGDTEPRKNLPTLISGWQRHRAETEAAKAPSLELVLAGAIRDVSVRAEGLRLVPAPGDAELAELLRGAALLVVPSLHEGFGLPALEAMAAGVPVIAARSPGLVEVCGTAASYFDPRDAASLADRLTGLAADPGARRALAGAGLDRARDMSWRASAELHVDAYEKAIRAR